MTKPRLVYFDFITHYGGAQRSTVMLFDRLRSQFDLQVVDAYGICSDYLDAVRQQGTTVSVLDPHASAHYIGGDGSRFNRICRLIRQIPAFWRLARSLRQVLHTLHPDVIVTNSPKALALLYVSGLYARYKIAFYARGWYRRSQIPVFARYLIKRCHCILAVSRATATALKAWQVPADRIHVAPTIIDVDDVLSQGAQGMADPLPQSDRSVKIVIPAQLVRTKGQHTAIEAARILQQQGHDFVMWICGDVKMGVSDAYRQQLTRCIEEYGLGQDVFLLGYRDDVRALIAQATMLVLPTMTEGFPRVIWEAMLLGCPVVATPAGGVTDLIIDGQTGLLFDMEDGEALADCIERLISQEVLRKQLADKARAYMSKHFAPEKTGEALDEALHRVLER